MDMNRRIKSSDLVKFETKIHNRDFCNGRDQKWKFSDLLVQRIEN